MIPIEHKDAVVTTGISFLRSITQAFGQEKGLELWDTIADTLDPDVKGQIFFSMLCGHCGSSITISGVNSCSKIGVIKAIREVTGLGLKEAKDISDSLMTTAYTSNGGLQYSFAKPTTITLSGKVSYNDSLNILRNAGCTV